MPNSSSMKFATQIMSHYNATMAREIYSYDRSYFADKTDEYLQRVAELEQSYDQLSQELAALNNEGLPYVEDWENHPLKRQLLHGMYLLDMKRYLPKPLRTRLSSTEQAQLIVEQELEHAQRCLRYNASRMSGQHEAIGLMVTPGELYPWNVPMLVTPPHRPDIRLKVLGNFDGLRFRTENTTPVLEVPLNPSELPTLTLPPYFKFPVFTDEAHLNCAEPEYLWRPDSQKDPKLLWPNGFLASLEPVTAR